MSIFSALFGEERSDKIERWKRELYELLVCMAEDGYKVDLDDDGDILVNKGSAVGCVYFAENDDDMYLVIDVPILLLPQENCLAFYRKLLDINSLLGMGRFCTNTNRVCYRTSLDVDFLTDDMVKMAVLESINVADEYDDELAEEFNAKRINDD